MSDATDREARLARRDFPELSKKAQTLRDVLERHADYAHFYGCLNALESLARRSAFEERCHAEGVCSYCERPLGSEPRCASWKHEVPRSPSPPLERVYELRVQLCASCDRPEICAILKHKTAPCGLNSLVELREPQANAKEENQ